MKVITIEELEKLAPGEATIVDVRPEEEFRRGTFEGAINIPMKEFSDRMDEIPKDKPVWLLCHTGERSVEYVELLCLSGYDAGNVEGGYRAFLRLQLGRFISEEDIMKEKTKEIERSLIKKFRKSIWRAFTISSSRGTRSQSAFPAVRILCLWQSFYRNCSVMENILLNWYFWS